MFRVGDIVRMCDIHKDKRWYNGSLFTVIKIIDDGIEVKLDKIYDGVYDTIYSSHLELDKLELRKKTIKRLCSE